MPLAAKLDAATWLEPTRELRRMGWDVTLVTPGERDGVQPIRGVDVFCISIPNVYLLRYAIFHFRLLAFLRRWQPADIILFHSSSAPWLLLLRWLCLPRRNRPLFVADTRSLYMPLKSRQGWRERLRDQYETVMDAMSIRWADGQTVITSRMAEALHIPPEKLWGMWPSGVDVQRFDACPAQRAWPKDKEPVHLGYIGALEYERNLMGLAAAVACANTDEMNFQFTLVGEGAQRAALESFARDSCGCVKVIPPIPYESVPEFLSRMHVGVLPFPDEEKFQVCSPIKLFEYMAAGLPVLATRIPCHTDVMKNGNYVFWAEPPNEDGLLDALRALWQKRHTLRDLSAESVLAAQAWTWSESAIRLKSALEGGLSRRAASGSVARHPTPGSPRSQAG